MIFRNRDEVERRFPARQIFRGKDHKVYGLWLTGHGVLRTLDKDHCNIRQLVLPNPQTAYLKRLEESTYQEFDFPRIIQQMTNRAKDLGIEVYWYGDFTGVAVTICDPDRKSGWVNVEPILPHMKIGERPHFRILKRRREEEVLRYWECFQEIVANSERQ